ncbi:MAG: hypothetical protein ACRDE5_05960, partial [Ginsengibacter sp.]
MKKLFYPLLFIALITSMNSCQKFDGNPFGHHLPGDKNDNANVAIDWYTLQIRILLERNSAFNGLNFSYIGVGLYESVRNSNPNAGSFYGN